MDSQTVSGTSEAKPVADAKKEGAISEAEAKALAESFMRGMPCLDDFKGVAA